MDAYFRNVRVFEEGQDIGYSQWRLARDLVYIRMVERLYQQGWLASNQGSIPDNADEAEPDSAS